MDDAEPRCEQLAEELFELAPAGYLIAHADGRILRANAALRNLVGRTAESLTTLRFQDLLPRAGQVYFDTHVRPLLAMQGFVHEIALELQVADTRKSVSVVLNATQTHEADGMPARLRIMVFESTARRQYERELLQARRAADEARETERIAREHAERASRAKDDFLALVSHELRSPLSAILGWTQILRRAGGDPEKLRQGLEVIERNTKQQSRLVEDLLDMSRMVAGKLRMDVQDVLLAEVIEAALGTVGPSAQARGVRLQKILDPTVHVSGDPGRLQQVFWNLLSNAIKFTPRDGFVRVVMERVNSHVEVRVIDSGQGMSTEVLAHAFERFRQSTDSSARNTEGLGLGLSIVKHLVETHGGSVSASSEGEGRGSTFLVQLPVRVARARRDRHPRSAVGNATSRTQVSLRGLKILVVDDDQDARDVLRHILSERGGEVVSCASATEGLTTIQRVLPDVLLSDIGMPGEDGYEFIRKVRLLGEPLSRVPAIALTAFSDIDDRTQALLAGFHAHLAKPVDAEELIISVAAMAGRPRPAHEA